MALYRLSLKHHGRLDAKATAAEHAAYIVRDLVTPETHAYVVYTLRQSRTSADREDLAHAEWHNLPAWSGNNPVQFFLEAERYEGANRRVSSSLEVALPRELSQQAQVALMQDYCASQFGRHAYVVGLHDSVGASGEPNPHFHVTWSERIHDGTERPAAAYFRRPPHGAGKDPIFRTATWLMATRQAWADMANLTLEQQGITDAYVDPRSLVHRGIDRAPEARLSAEHSTKAKLGKEITPAWQAVLEGRTHRAAFRALEQAIAADAWTVRKAALGITDVQAVNRAAFVEQIAQWTRTQALQPRRRQSASALQAEAEHLAEGITHLTTVVRSTEQAMAYEERLAQRQQGRPRRQHGGEHAPRVMHGYDPRGQIFERGHGRGY